MSYQISGEPAWASQKEFDISATIGEAESKKLETLTKQDARAERQLMLQGLLADRFGLAVHHETKEENAYALVLAKGGPKFHESNIANIPPGAAPRPVIQIGGGQLTLNGGPISLLTLQLSQVTGRPVLDRTGLTGKYDFTLKWTTDEFDLSAVAQGSEDSPTAEPAGTSIFTVIQDQLGLKLDSTKAPIDTIVIDHVEPPTPN
jgi:uncharacterized protein (TIGR03435 family)